MVPMPSGQGREPEVNCLVNPGSGLGVPQAFRVPPALSMHSLRWRNRPPCSLGPSQEMHPLMLALAVLRLQISQQF